MTREDRIRSLVRQLLTEKDNEQLACRIAVELRLALRDYVEWMRDQVAERALNDPPLRADRARRDSPRHVPLPETVSHN